MSSNIIKADNGASSGITGIVQTAGNDGTLLLQTTTSGGTPTTALTIDTAQSVGIGVTPSAWGSTYNKYTTQIGTYASLGTNTYGTGSTILAHNYYSSASSTLYLNTGGYASNYAQSGGGHSWSICSTSGTAGGSVSLTTAMTLDNGGRLGIGATPSASWSSGTAALQVSTAGNIWGRTSDLLCAVGSNSGYNGGDVYLATGYASRIYFNAGNIYTNTAGSGSAGANISYSSGPYVSQGSGSWSNSSDERLKNITGEIQNGLIKVASLRAAEFTWKSDTTNKAQVGLIAQDVQAVLPEAVNSNAYVPNDTTEYLGVSYTEVIPLLVAAIKELSTELTALKAKVGA